jgi:hypothetical protein
MKMLPTATTPLRAVSYLSCSEAHHFYQNAHFPASFSRTTLQSPDSNRRRRRRVTPQRRPDHPLPLVASPEITSHARPPISGGPQASFFRSLSTRWPVAPPISRRSRGSKIAARDAEIPAMTCGSEHGCEPTRC